MRWNLLLYYLALVFEAGISFNLNDFEKHRIVLLKRSGLRFFLNLEEYGSPNALNKEILAAVFKRRAQRGFVYEHKIERKKNTGLLESVAGIVHDY